MAREQQIALWADNILGREHEVAQYQANIDSYTTILAALPQGDHPAELEPHISMEAAKLPHTVPVATRMQVADYQLRDRLRAAISEEMVQQNIAKWALHGAKAQIPAADYDQAMAAATARRAAQ